MNMIIFCTAFIFQYVGHNIGDYLFQTDWQAQNKTKKRLARFRHCFVYSLTIGLLLLIPFNWVVASIVFLITLIEHYLVDSRKPIIVWKNFLEKKIAKQKNFEIKNVPQFVIISIDQTVHIVRIFIIAIAISCFI
ncbi:hypothetical protein BN990_04220 [Virgibacillus salexigens]|uniref:DUF3307 domain-containing protein n=1 Tax=Virgibacillus massiliensis TaxID=1462526 RepID=A0A024QIQ5_9BACI|nr:hypothetical protein BN990_04220 [Virgibacillus massiliensis]